MQTDWFKKRMRELGLTQEELSRSWGRDRNSVSRIIRGDQVMDVQEAAQFSRALQTPLIEIVLRAIAGDGEALDGITSSSAGGIPMRFRIAAMESGAGAFDMSDKRISCAPPPKWKATPNAFAAEIADDSADRYYAPGTILFCVPLADLGRPPKTGERCVYLNFTKSVADGKPYEARLGVLSAAPDGTGAMIVGASRDQTKATTVWFDRQQPAPALHEKSANFDAGSKLPENIDLTPHAQDKAEIVGIVVSHYSAAS